ncbi:uncharacterized protein G2W53_033594 [Senna tora]|uniref:Uncharacterized protein n=1 Tax=Senna tora TaxID=362788 RepID=A0A834SXU3_9FABA|nr:uncharacterized protein G2W53_033594 [Senna tora]
MKKKRQRFLQVKRLRAGDETASFAVRRSPFAVPCRATPSSLLEEKIDRASVSLGQNRCGGFGEKKGA